MTSKYAWALIATMRGEVKRLSLELYEPTNPKLLGLFKMPPRVRKRKAHAKVRPVVAKRLKKILNYKFLAQYGVPKAVWEARQSSYILTVHYPDSPGQPVEYEFDTQEEAETKANEIANAGWVTELPSMDLHDGDKLLWERF